MRRINHSRWRFPTLQLLIKGVVFAALGISVFGNGVVLAQLIQPQTFPTEEAPEPSPILQVQWPRVASLPPKPHNISDDSDLEIPSSEIVKNGVSSDLQPTVRSILKDFPEKEDAVSSGKTTVLKIPRTHVPVKISGSTKLEPKTKLPTPMLNEEEDMEISASDEIGEIDSEVSAEELPEYDLSALQNPYLASAGMEGYVPGMEYGIPQDMTLSPHRPASQWLFDNMTVSAGSCIFNDDINLKHRGTFGSNIEINWAGPLIIPMQLSGQFGGRYVQSNYNKSNMLPDFYEGRDRVREQFYLSGGLFKRFANHPFQIGAVYDWCADETYQSLKYAQFRTEMSFWTQSGLELGVRGAFGVMPENVQFQFFDPITSTNWTSDFELKSRTYYTAFIKKYHQIGASGMLYGGSSNYGELRCGLEYEVPLTDRLTMRSGFSLTYSDKEHQVSGEKREGWNVAFTIVYHPHGRMFKGIQNPLRAMFDVADSGTMLPKYTYRRSYTGP